LTKIAHAVLTALNPPKSAYQVSVAAGVPLYRVRATLRETAAAGLIVTMADELIGLTDKGLEVLELSGED
jgi:hypothetical protein